MQLQSVTKELPGDECVFTGHVTHVVLDVSAEYLPAEHGAHGVDPLRSLNEPAVQGAHAPPSRPANPTLHRHPWRTVLPAGEDEWAGQLVHAAFESAATKRL